MKRKLYLLVAFLISSLCAWSQSVTIDKITYSLYDRDGVTEAYVSGSDEDITEVNIRTKVEIGGVEYNVTKIGDGAFGFGDYRNITSVDIPEGIVIIGFDAFRAPLKRVTISSTVKEIGRWAFGGGWEDEPPMESISVSPDNPYFDSRENCNAVIQTDLSRAIAIFKCSTLPSSLKILGNCCLCNDFTTLTLNDGLEVIESSALATKRIENLYIPKTLKECGSVGDFDVQNLILAEDNPNFIVVDNCLIKVPEYRLIGIGKNFSGTIPSGIQQFEWYCFGGYNKPLTSLEEIPFKMNVGTIGIDNCDLIVPEGSIPRYLYQGWFNSGFRSISDGISKYALRSSEGSFWWGPGFKDDKSVVLRAGVEKELSIHIATDTPPIGFQFDLYLPDGINLVNDEYGEPVIRLSSERTTSAKHSLDYIQRSDGSWRIICTSKQGDLFSGTEGEVCTIKVKVDENLNFGSYPVGLKNRTVICENVQHKTDDYIGYINVMPDVKTHDVNDDDEVNTQDVMQILKYIRTGAPGGKQVLEDVNGDGKVDTQDVLSVYKYMREH